MSTHPCMDTGHQQEVIRGFKELLRSAEVFWEVEMATTARRGTCMAALQEPSEMHVRRGWVQESLEERCSSGGGWRGGSLGMLDINST